MNPDGNARKSNVGIWVIILIIVLLIVVGIRSGKGDDNVLTIGGIFPMTGANAIYGEEFSKGLQLAIDEYAASADKKANIVLSIEDSKADAKEGVSAYQKLVAEGADVVVPLLSRVVVPIISRSAQDKVPVLASMSSSDTVVSTSTPYAFRIFNVAANTGATFVPIAKKLGAKKIGVLWINDEYGVSNLAVIKKEASLNNMVIIDTSYGPTDNDYRTQLTGLKSQGVDMVVVVAIPPQIIITSITQARQLGIKVPIVDTGCVMQNQGALKQAGAVAEGLYTCAVPFTLNPERAALFVAAYKVKYDVDPTYISAYGYDAGKLLVEASHGGTSRERVLQFLLSKESFSGTAADYQVNGNHSFIAPVQPAKIVNGKLENI